MRCERNRCNGPMALKGYGRDRYYSCVLCGNLIYQNPSIQEEAERRREAHERAILMRSSDVSRD